MNKCKRCNVWVADDTMVCPLCHTILTENKSMEQSLDHNANKMQGVQRPGYPDVKKNAKPPLSAEEYTELRARCPKCRAKFLKNRKASA